MTTKQIKSRGKPLVTGWWEIELRRTAHTGTPLLACLHHRKRVDREVLRESHKANPLADLGDLLKRLTERRSLVVRLTGDPHDVVVHQIEQNDFDLDQCDVAAVAESIYRLLATELLPSELSASSVIKLRAWLQKSCYAIPASRIERILTRTQH